MKDNQEEIQRILALINKATNDDDERQELWVYYLSDKEEFFNEFLKKIKFKAEEHNRLHNLISTIRNKEKLSLFLSNFYSSECNIILLLIMKFSPEEISSYKSISMIRVNQMISSVVNSNIIKEIRG